MLDQIGHQKWTSRPDDALLARIGALEVRLATTPAELRAAQRLRYAVFVDEMGATLAGADHGARTEADGFDTVCDHVIVIDRTLPYIAGAPAVVGTYRALRPERAGSTGFYSQAEFDIAPLLARKPHLAFCEVGRSCVAPTHRAHGIIEALWSGLFAYASRHGIDVYFGAGSLPGTDVARHAQTLALIAHGALAPADWQIEAKGPDAVCLKSLPAPKDVAAARRATPALIRGYLNMGARIGQTAHIDRAFGAIDVMVLTVLAQAPARYRRHFSRLSAIAS